MKGQLVRAGGLGRREHWMIKGSGLLKWEMIRPGCLARGEALAWERNLEGKGAFLGKEVLTREQGLIWGGLDGGRNLASKEAFRLRRLEQAKEGGPH